MIGELSVSAGACTYSYVTPKVFGFNFPWSVPDGRGGLEPDYRETYPVAEQLADDMALYLAPYRTRRTVPVDQLLPRQAHGYPVKPTSKTCR